MSRNTSITTGFSEKTFSTPAMFKGMAIPALVTTLLSMFILSGCGNDATAQGQQGAAPMAIPVPVVKVVAKDLPLVWEYPAQVSGYREVEIRARVSGIIEKRNFEEGAKVKQGQSLYALDNNPYKVALIKAQADEKAAQVRVAQTERDLARIKPLLVTKAVSQLEVDNAQSANELALANLAVAKAQVRQASLNLEYARVESPVTGYAGRSMKDEGSLVSGPQDLLTTVTQVDKVYLNFGIPEADHKTMQGDALAMPASGKLQVEVLGADGQPTGVNAQLAFQDVRVNPSTGTVGARSLIQNKSEALSPGQFARVRLTGAVQKGAITLPQRAVIQSPMGGKIVMTVSPENTVAPRPVTVAQWEGDQWVITSGLKDGDLVLTDGYIKAQPGSPVKPMIQGGPQPGSEGDQAQPAKAN